MNAFWICCALLAFQDGAPEPVEPVDPVRVMAQARRAFAEEAYGDVLGLLQPLVAANHGEAMLLAADASYAVGSPRALRRAIHLYKRCLYEDDGIPFPDHSYRQLAQIYLTESRRSAQEGRVYDARESAAEAEFYMRRLLKKFPNSFYRDATLNQILDLAIARGEHEKALEYAALIWDSATNGRLLSRVEPMIFIYQEPFEETPEALADMFARHRRMISGNRNLLLKYATRFEDLGRLDAARRLFLQVYNQWPDWGDSAQSLSRLADLHRRRGEWDAAAFLYRMILLENPGTEAEANAWLGLAQMMEEGRLFSFQVDDTSSLSYRDLVNRIRHSVLPDEVRARYSYKQALYESFSDPEAALLTLSNLLAEYERGPFVGLYRNFYEQLLFTVIRDKFAAGDDWGLDRLYRQHHHFLAFTTQTRYPHMIAKAYLRLDLPTSAIGVYDAMWQYKESITGFDLAFEEPLTDYLLLLNTMRRDERLKLRLRDYAGYYARNGRFLDQYLYVDTAFKSRTMDRLDFLEHITGLPQTIGTLFDARRLRLMIVTAQEAALLDRVARKDAEAAGKSDDAAAATAAERTHWAFADTLFNAALTWPALPEKLPILVREARLFQADRLYTLGNYFEAEQRYEAILSDASYASDDRDWAYLQLARLHELKGETKTSLRIYGQLAYAASAKESVPAAFAKRRLSAVAGEKRLRELEKERGLGQF